MASERIQPSTTPAPDARRSGTDAAGRISVTTDDEPPRGAEAGERPAPLLSFERIAFLAPDHAQDAVRRLADRYGQHPVDTADIIVALGGDGFMLDTLHRHMGLGIPIFGMNRGTVGFLMNSFAEGGLIERLHNATPTTLSPLRTRAVGADGEETELLAINEVSLHRQTGQAAKVRISIDGQVRMEELICDGILVATPAGSSAYNYSAHGPILPLSAGVLALTPISPFRPRRWRGALLPHGAKVSFDVLEADKRPVSASPDAREIRNIVRATVEEDRNIRMHLLFDPEHNLEDRILNEQFRL